MNWKAIIIAGLVLVSGNLYADKPDGKTLPFHGVFSGFLIEFNDDANVIAARCNPPEGRVAWAVASFIAWSDDVTHLGETEMLASHCSYVPVDPPSASYGEGEFQLTADNGDILLGTYTNGWSLSPPPVIGFMEDSAFHDGGTGRFTFASGNGMDIGSMNVLDGSITMHMTGVIDYSKR